MLARIRSVIGYRSYYKGLSVVMCCFMLAACASENSISSAYDQARRPVKGAVIGGGVGGVAGYALAGNPAGILPGVAVGAAIGGVIGWYLDQHASDKQLLENDHVQVIKVGDYVKLVIPTQGLFDAQFNLQSQARRVLHTVAKIVKPYPKVTIEIAVYTEGTPTDLLGTMTAQELTDRQAQVVADYLWHQDLDARLLYAKGYGTANPIVVTSGGGWKNSRIEIFLQEQHIDS